MELVRDAGGLQAVVTATEWPAITQELSEAWPALAESFRQYVTQHPERQWDRMRLYARFESGLIFVTPDAESADRYVDAGSFQVEHIEALYYQLPEEDAAFEAAHASMAEATAGALRASALMPGAREALGALQSLRPFDITWIEYDDYETEQVLVRADELA